MASVEFKVEGLKELQRKLGRKVNLQPVLQEVGVEAQRQAQLRSPVDSGIMRRSITFNVSGKKLTVTSPMGYSGFVEYGTRYQVAQPFFRPGVEAASLKLETLLKERLREVF